jgi:hypothetical protein
MFNQTYQRWREKNLSNCRSAMAWSLFNAPLMPKRYSAGVPELEGGDGLQRFHRRAETLRTETPNAAKHAREMRLVGKADGFTDVNDL